MVAQISISLWLLFTQFTILEYKEHAVNKRRKNNEELIAGKISYQGGSVIILSCPMFFLVADFTEMLLR